MILPIVAYGDAVLKKEAVEIDQDFPDLKKLIADMYETMYHAQGVGLAAPQIGKSIRLFIVDGSPFADDEDEEGGVDEHRFWGLFGSCDQGERKRGEALTSLALLLKN
mgnify:CR=1 FL=1